MLKSPPFLFSQSPLHISTRNLLPQIESAGGGDNRSGVNPVRNSSRCDSKPSGALDPALRGGTPYGAEPGIILKCNPAAAAGPAAGSEEPLARRDGLPPGQKPFRGGAWPGGSSGALFLTG